MATCCLMSMGSVGSEKWRGRGNLPVIVMSPNLQFHKYFIQNISKVSKTKYLIPKILESTRYKEVPGIIAVFDVFVHQFSSIILYNPSTLKKVNVDFVRLKFFPQNAQNLFLSWEDEIRWVSAFVKAFVFTRPFVPLYSSLQVKRTGQKLPAVGSRSAFMVTSKRQPMCIYGDVDENKQQAEE